MSHTHKAILPLLLLGALYLASAGATRADAVIYQSALPGPSGQISGTSLHSNQFLGARFSIAAPIQVTQVGGHLFVQNPPNTLFAVIVRLSGPGAFPSGSPPAMSDVIASTTFVGPNPSNNNFLMPLNATLIAGDYALIFGAGQFGSSTNALGAMPNNNTDLPGASYFFWLSSNGAWVNGLFSNTRFVVMGDPAITAVPEPATMLLLGTGLAGIAATALKRRRKS